MDPKCRGLWTRLDGGSGRELYVAKSFTERAVSAGEWLTLDVNQLSWYVAALGSSYNVSNWHPCIPSGHLATALLERNPDQVLLCGCDSG
jgi:hypothetical protein